MTSGKHSEHDTGPACFVICTLLELLRHRKLHCIAWSTWTRRKDAMCVRFGCGYSAEVFRSIWSPRSWFALVGCSPFGHRETAKCSVRPVALSSCTFQIQVKLSSYFSIMEWQHRSDWYSATLYTESDESSWLANDEMSKVYIYFIIYNAFNTA